jgi:hypothetical protein
MPGQTCKVRFTRHPPRTHLDNKWWVKLSLSHPPEKPAITRRRLRLLDHQRSRFSRAASCWWHGLGYAVFERSALNLIFDLAITQSAFKGDELPLLERFGELREIPPGIDAMPFGPGFVVAFVVLPAFLGCDVEDDVLAVSQLANTILTDLNPDKSNADGYTGSNVLPLRE